VDDVKVDEGRLPAGVSEIAMGTNSNLYFGGAPITINDMAGSSKGLDGCIGDIITNEKYVAKKHRIYLPTLDTTI
jgi:hypothetical protein